MCVCVCVGSLPLLLSTFSHQHPLHLGMCLFALYQFSPALSRKFVVCAYIFILFVTLIVGLPTRLVHKSLLKLPSFCHYKLSLLDVIGRSVNVHA